jgi:hypothetical protein
LKNETAVVCIPHWKKLLFFKIPMLYCYFTFFNFCKFTSTVPLNINQLYLCFLAS